MLVGRDFNSRAEPRAGPLNLDALGESREWCSYKKNSQKI